MENQDQATANWSSVYLLAFRFVLVYLVLYWLPFPFGAFPHTGSVARRYQLLWHMVVPWVGKHILHLGHEIVVSTNCSGDTTYDYVKVICLLGPAFAGSVLWYSLERSHSDYQRVDQWLRSYVRLSVGAAMLLFGAAKVFRVQFPPPNLYKLLEPQGDSSPMGLLWTFMATSRSYSLFAGFIQMLGGILLFVPRLTTLGALVGIAVFSNIFVLNVGYDVPLKLLCLHFLIACFFLILPDARRLVDFFLLNRSVAPSPEIGFLSNPRLNAGALVTQLMLGGFLVCSDLYRAYDYERRNFGIASRPSFYGIWIVDEFSLGGKVLPPLLTDENRWQRVVFQFPKGVGVQSMNGAWTGYKVRRDMAKKTLAMEEDNDPKKKFEFILSSSDSESLTLEGNDGASEIRIMLHRMDERRFSLLGRGSQWINEDAEFVRDEEGVCNHVRQGGELLVR